MKKNRMMKKGEIKSWILWLVLATVFLVIMFAFPLPLLGKQLKDIGTKITVADFDGDNKEEGNAFGTDIQDPCKCGWDNVPVRAATKEYCVADFTPDQCACANSIASVVELDKPINSDIKKSGVKVSMFFESSDGKVCLYSDSGCEDLIAGNKMFMDQLNSGQPITGCTAGTTAGGSK